MLLIKNKENSENSAHHMINATIANGGESPETANTVMTQGVKIADWQGTTIVSLSSDVFERRTSTGSELFALLSRDFDQIFGQIVSIRIKTLDNKIW